MTTKICKECYNCEKIKRCIPNLTKMTSIFTINVVPVWLLSTLKRFRATLSISILHFLFNPFVPNAPFLNPLEIPENCKVFYCFQKVEKGCTGNKWVNNLNIYKFGLATKDPLKTMKNAFQFISEALFIVKNINFCPGFFWSWRKTA